MSTELETFRQQIAELGRRNLYFLCKGILGFDRLTGGLHREVCSVIEDPGFSKKLIMIPRGHYKSTIGTKGRAIQWVINNPNERILIVSATSTNAERFLRHIESQFEQNALFRWLYPEILPGPRAIWSRTEAIVKRNQSFPEPTFDTGGVGTAFPSRHYTKIIKDDIVNDKNVNTQELIDQVIEWDASTVPLFDDPEDPSNEELVIGTPWSNVDVYAIKRRDPDYGVYIRHSLEDSKGEPDFEHGQPIFPERFSKERLDRIRRRLMNDDLFFCQYMCDPHGGGNADFQRAYLQYYSVVPSLLEISITVDPGGIRDKDGDFTAFTVVGVDINNDWYVLDAFKQRLNPREIIETMFRLYGAYPTAHTIGIETVAYQRTLLFFAQEKMRETGVFLPVKELTTSTRESKEMRIKGLIPRFSNHAIYLKEGMKDLEDELFRRVKYDDLKDALAYQLQVAQLTPRAVNTTSFNPLSIESILAELAGRHRGVAELLRKNLGEEFYTEPKRTGLTR